MQTLREFLELHEDYDILGERQNRARRLRERKAEDKEYGEKIANVSDDEWKESKRKTARRMLGELTPEELESVNSRLSELEQVTQIYQRLLNEIPKDRPEWANVKKMVDDHLKEVEDIKKFKAQGNKKISGVYKRVGVSTVGNPDDVKIVKNFRTSKQRQIDKLLGDAEKDRRFYKAVYDK